MRQFARAEATVLGGCVVGFVLLGMAVSFAADGALPASVADSAAAIDAGRLTFVEQCSVCHAIDGSAAFGPGLKGVLRRPAFIDGAPVTEDGVVRTILDGRGQMPRIPLDAQQLSNLLAYLRST